MAASRSATFRITHFAGTRRELVRALLGGPGADDLVDVRVVQHVLHELPDPLVGVGDVGVGSRPRYGRTPGWCRSGGPCRTRHYGERVSHRDSRAGKGYLAGTARPDGLTCASGGAAASILEAGGRLRHARRLRQVSLERGSSGEARAADSAILSCVALIAEGATSCQVVLDDHRTIRRGWLVRGGLQEFVDGDDVAGIGADAAGADAAGEQIPVRAVSFGEAFSVVGALLDGRDRDGVVRHWSPPPRVPAALGRLVCRHPGVAHGDLAQRMLHAVEAHDLFVDVGAAVAPGALDGVGRPRGGGQCGERLEHVLASLAQGQEGDAPGHSSSSMA